MENQSLLLDLLVKTREFVEKQGYAQGTKYKYIAGMNNLRRHFNRQEQIAYSRDTAWNYVLERRAQYENGDVAYDTFLYVWKVAEMLEECSRTGCITRHNSSVWGRVCLSVANEALMYEYEHLKIEKGYSIRTLVAERSAIRNFLLFLERKGIDGVSKVQRSDISEYVPVLAEHNSAGISGILTRLRAFFRYLTAEGLIDERLILSLQLTSAVRKKVRFGFSVEEANKIMNAIDQNSAIGKRDYAILSLARYTGLRAIDVTHLKMTDIDWNNNEIRIVQHKTKRPLILPLENHVGNALADYILNARPNSDSIIIFLRSRAPYEALGHGNGTSITRRYAAKAGVTWKSNEYKGFHSFRRSIGTDMLAADVPLTTISEVLGHSRIDSTKPYLAADVQNLKMCALPLLGFECTKEELR